MAENMEMLKKHLEEALTEENKDSEKYITMAGMAPLKYKPILLDIAREEGIHQMHLATILQDMEMCMAMGDHSGTTPEK